MPGTKKGEDAKHKFCKPKALGGCGKLKLRLKDFKPRWGRCEKHKEQGKTFQEKCKACHEARDNYIRQPYCIECDAKRGSKKTAEKKKAAAGKTTGRKKKTTAVTVAETPVAPTAPVTPTEVPVATAPAPQAAPPATVTPQAVAAPPPVVHHTAPPASPPTPAPTPSSSLSAVSALLEQGEKEAADDSAGPATKGAVAPATVLPLSTQASGEPPAVGQKHGFRGPPAQGPSLIRRGTQGCTQKRHYVQANLTEIKRILLALTTREKRVARAEERLETANARVRELIGEIREAGESPDPAMTARYEKAKTKREHEIARVNNAKAWREFTSKKLRLFLDYALTHTPYTKAKTCPDGPCEKCGQTGLLREENQNPFAKAAVPILKHIARVLDATELCFKIRARTADSNDAYEKLLSEHQGLVRKFGNPHQTALEGDDAAQGAMLGIFDGAVRFDPTKPVAYFCPVETCGYREKIVLNKRCAECERLERRCDRCQFPPGKPCPKCGLKLMVQTSVAVLQTVAWSWAKRNSRARKTTDERPGLRPSIDDPGLGGKKAEDGGVADQVAVIDGRAQIVTEGTKVEDDGLKLAAMDLRTQIEALTDPDQKKVVELCLAGLSPSEIGRSLGMTSRQVVKTKDQAFSVLREKLAGYLEV